MRSSSLHAARGEHLGFPHDRVGGAAAVVATERRNNAEGALVIAAFGNLQIRIVSRSREKSWRIRVVDIGRQLLRSNRDAIRSQQRDRSRADDAEDVLDFASADDGIDLRNFCAQFVAIAFTHAAGDDQFPAAPVLLVLRHLENGVDRLLPGFIDERAGVDDEHVGVGRVPGELMTGLLREPEHDLGVDEVLRAAEGYHSNLHGENGVGGHFLRTLQRALGSVLKK
jgi:hypothetical protein